MQTSVVSSLCAALVCGALVPVITRFARRRGLFDHITSTRKIHSRQVPRLGGVAIVAGFYAPLLALILYPTGVGSLFYSEPTRAFAFLFGGLAIAGLGFFDDIFGAGPMEKFSIQFAVALYVCWAGFRIDRVSLFGDVSLPLGPWGAVLTSIWIVGVMNAMNLIDGLDGLAAGIGLFSALTNLVIAGLGGHPLMGLWMSALAGSLIAFLLFNFHPASIFMGDGGSLFIGYVLAVSSIRTSQKSTAAVSLLVPIVALALPIADTLLAMLRRGLRGRPLFSGDREHIHHRLLALGLSHRQTVLVLYGSAIVLGAVAIALTTLAPGAGLIALLGLAVAVGLSLRRLGFLRLGGAVEVLQQRRRNLALRGVVKNLSEELLQAGTTLHIEKHVASLAPVLDAHAVRLHLGMASAERGRAGQGSVQEVPRSLTLRLPIDPGYGHVEIEWRDGRTQPDRDHEIAAETVCRVLSRALERTLANSPREFLTTPERTARYSGRTDVA